MTRKTGRYQSSIYERCFEVLNKLIFKKNEFYCLFVHPKSSWEFLYTILNSFYTHNYTVSRMLKWPNSWISRINRYTSLDQSIPFSSLSLFLFPSNCFLTLPSLTCTPTYNQLDWLERSLLSNSLRFISFLSPYYIKSSLIPPQSWIYFNSHPFSLSLSSPSPISIILDIPSEALKSWLEVLNINLFNHHHKALSTEDIMIV